MMKPLGEPSMSMRFLTATAVFLLFAPLATLTAQGDPDRAVTGDGSLPAGWHVRPETSPQTGQPAPLDNAKFANMGDGLHTTVRPAPIYGRARDTISAHSHLASN